MQAAFSGPRKPLEKSVFYSGQNRSIFLRRDAIGLAFRKDGSVGCGEDTPPAGGRVGIQATGAGGLDVAGHHAVGDK